MPSCPMTSLAHLMLAARAMLLQRSIWATNRAKSARLELDPGPLLDQMR
jgi:hypothetical protein